MRTATKNLINGQPPIFGNRSQIALQKAKEAGVVDLKPVAKAIKGSYSITSYDYRFDCPNCSWFVWEELKCYSCETKFYLDSLGRIFQLPQENGTASH